MTSIHAPVPPDLKTAVVEAKSRGEDAGTVIPEHEGTRSVRSRIGTRVQSLTMKMKKPSNRTNTDNPETDDESDGEPTHPSISKENNPSLSPTPVKLAPPSPRKNAHGKRPLAVLTTTLDPDLDLDQDPNSTPMDFNPDPDLDLNLDLAHARPMTTSEKNIAANHTRDRDPSPHPQPQRKSPKLSLLDKGLNASARIRDDVIIIFEDGDASAPLDLRSHRRDNSKENQNQNQNHSAHTSKEVGPSARKTHPHYPSSLLGPSAAVSCPSGSKSRAVSGSRKVSSSSMKKAKPRIGIRRL
jgi:ubiquitin-conjugating enzyme E2 S